MLDRVPKLLHALRYVPWLQELQQSANRLEQSQNTLCHLVFPSPLHVVPFVQRLFSERLLHHPAFGSVQQFLDA